MSLKRRSSYYGQDGTLSITVMNTFPLWFSCLHDCWALKTFVNGREDDKWWLLPTILLLFKSAQARFVDWHIANLEIQDFSLFTPDPDTFWAYEAVSWHERLQGVFIWEVICSLYIYVKKICVKLWFTCAGFVHL